MRQKLLKPSDPVNAMDGNFATDAFDADGGFLYDEREAAFHLWELYRVDQTLLGREPYGNLDRGKVEQVLRAGREHARRLARANVAGDRSPARLTENGEVQIPGVFHELWEEHKRDWFWIRQQGDSVRPASGELRLPHPVNQILTEMFVGANPSFMTYAGFTPSGANLIRGRGSEVQKQLLLDKLDSVDWDACFCATEPEAGSDLGPIKTTGERMEDGTYSIVGEKKYITAGMHPLTSNTVYILLGRIKGADATSFSFSCFLVPRFWPAPDGELLDNGVDCICVEDKMGLNGCANTHLRFGARKTTRGWLLGDKANVGLLQLANLMRKARIGTGHMALAISSNAYLHSLRYARRRIQGARFEESANPRAKRVAIIEHLDVQRMLLEMRAKVEGCRTLMARIAVNGAAVQTILAQETYDRAAVESLVQGALFYAPIVKAYVSDQAWQIVTQAIQVHGAVGYLRDLPLEQAARDIKILSIWEGTNYIQSQDFVRDKLAFGKNTLAMREIDRQIRSFIGTRADFPELAAEFDALEQAMDVLAKTVEFLKTAAEDGRGPGFAQYFTRILEMFGHVFVAWGLIEAASVAVRSLASADAADRDYYQGKIQTAKYFAHNVLPQVHASALIVQSPERSGIAIADAQFGFDAALRAAGPRQATDGAR